MAKSTLILDIKPNDSETDLGDLEKKIRGIAKEGLLWGAAELKPVAYGVNKIRIIAVIVDDLVGVDDLQEEIEDFEEVQSTDVHALINYKLEKYYIILGHITLNIYICIITNIVIYIPSGI